MEFVKIKELPVVECVLCGVCNNFVSVAYMEIHDGYKGTCRVCARTRLPAKKEE